MGRVFLAYGTPLTGVSLLRYLIQTLSSTDNDFLAVEWKLRRAQGKWGRLEKILGRKGVDKRTMGRLYVAVVQVVLLFGSEMLVLTPRLEKALEGFHHWEARNIVGMIPNHQTEGTWVYPPIGVALAMLGLEEIRVYIARQQNTVTK